MFCPSCGAADQKPNAYCRRCGQWLVDPDSPRRRSSHTPAERMKAMLVFSGVNALLALIAATSLYATYLGRPEAKWSVYVAAAFCMVIAVHQTISFFFNLDLRRKFKLDRAPRRAIEPKPDYAVAFPPSLETGDLIQAPSVTETTTQLLEADPRGGEESRPQKLRTQIRQ
jgi:hypothetical protein